MLSPAELFAVRSREQTLPQRSHGQKDFLPDGSDDQDAKLQVCRTEQWELLREERVERLGNLGRGVWKPKEDLVELTLPAGKYWQTMGFTESGRQCLLAEEAVYLLECGAIQLYYRDLLLSVQEAYEKLFSHGSSVSLMLYQVYSHLKRLGYIVTRFNASSIQTQYERKLNIVTHGRKRKWNSSPSLRPTFEASKNKDKEEVNLVTNSTSGPDEVNLPSVPKQCVQGTLQRNQQAKDEMESCCLDSSLKSPSKSSQVAAYEDIAETKCLGSSRWDFSKICFPNFAPHDLCLQLPDPEPALLPENVSVHPADISHWLGKLNLCKRKLTRREQEQWDWEQKFKVSINSNPKVKKCTNWKEYKELLKVRAHHAVQERPAHLWKSAFQLLRPGPGKCTAFVLEEITVMPQCTLSDGDKSFLKIQNTSQIHFNLYQSDGTSEFKKSKPGKPYARLCVRSFDEQIPSLLALKMLSYQSGEVPVLFALVDYGEVAFYSFKDFQLPVDVFP